jgi:hypothetical protein
VTLQSLSYKLRAYNVSGSRAQLINNEPVVMGSLRSQPVARSQKDIAANNLHGQQAETENMLTNRGISAMAFEFLVMMTMRRSVVQAARSCKMTVHYYHTTRRSIAEGCS